MTHIVHMAPWLWTTRRIAWPRSPGTPGLVRGGHGPELCQRREFLGRAHRVAGEVPSVVAVVPTGGCGEGAAVFLDREHLSHLLGDPGPPRDGCLRGLPPPAPRTTPA